MWHKTKRQATTISQSSLAKWFNKVSTQNTASGQVGVAFWKGRHSAPRPLRQLSWVEVQTERWKYLWRPPQITLTPHPKQSKAPRTQDKAKSMGRRESWDSNEELSSQKNSVYTNERVGSAVECRLLITAGSEVQQQQQQQQQQQ